MNRIVTFSAVALAAAMLVPTGLAGWGSLGGNEPDNSFDTTGYMWTDPPTGSNQVYFNVYDAEGMNGGIAINQAELGSRLSTVGEGAWRAVLGVWVDCNHDGYVGMADGALAEYRAEASSAAGHPVDTGLCPVETESAANAGQVHNDGNWVTELIPIARLKPSQLDNASNYRILLDPTIKVWGDLHTRPQTPDAPLAPTDHCAQAGLNPPFSTGETSHTGGIISHVMCVDSRHAPTANDLWAAATADDPTGLLAPTAQGLPAGLAFSKPSDLYTNGGALDKPTFGTDQSCANGEPQPCQSSNSVVYNEFDCSKAPAVDQHQKLPVGADTWANATVYAPGNPKVNPSGTVPATVNETFEENSVTGDCNGNDDSGHDFYGNGVTESTTPSDAYVGNKVAPDMVFDLDGPQTRGVCQAQTPYQAVVDSSGNGDPVPNDPAIVPPALCGAPEGDFGQPLRAVTVFTLGSDEWWNGVTYTGTAPNVVAPSFDRTKGSLTLDTFQGDWFSFYASVGLSGVALPGAVGTYGTEFCTGGIGRDAPNIYGWNCDPAQWNVDPVTGQKTLTSAQIGQVGDAYNLRDVDCYDTTLVSAADSPTHQDVGARSAPLLSEPGSGCA